LGEGGTHEEAVATMRLDDWAIDAQDRYALSPLSAEPAM
jgi:hypothetical protein